MRSRSCGLAMSVILLAWLAHSPKRAAFAQLVEFSPATPFSQGQRALGIQGEQYGVLLATHALAQRVEQIFTKLLRVSGKRRGASFEVYVLDTPKILVQALPGGAVVISRGAVDLAGRDDDALAFLLAHEIAHVIRDHHGLLSSYQQISVTGTSTPPAPGKDEEVKALQAMELEADRLGLLYTSLGGFRGRAAVPILQRIIAATGSSPFHPNPHQREGTLRATMGQITAHIELFSLGLVYLATGRYEEAARIYETFASLYPSREVYNNLGVAYHKWALLYRRDDGWFRSIMVDAETRARATLKDIVKSPEKQLTEEVHPLFRKYVDRALAAYRLAAESDPDYAIGHNNLALAYLEAGEYDFAVGEFKRALRLDAKLAAAWNNRGVAYMKTGDVKQAEADFLRAVALDPTYPEPHGNLARLHERLGKTRLAASARGRFDQLKRGPSPQRALAQGEVIAGVQVGMDAPKVLNNDASEWLAFHVPLGLREEDVLRVLVNNRDGVLIATRQGKADVVGAIEGYHGRTALGVTLGASSRQVRSTYGPPPKREESHTWQLWVYPGRGVVFVLVGDRVASWWLPAASVVRAP